MLLKNTALALAVLTLVTLIAIPNTALSSPSNPPPNPYELIRDIGMGAGPITVDPANCYDTMSQELLINVYETLIFFDGERYDVFTPMLATQVWIAPPDPASPAYTNFTIYFKTRTSVPFHNRCRTDEPIAWDQYYLTTEDVEYSIERLMVHDYIDGPQWMMYDALLDCYTADVTDPSFGTKIDNAVESNETHVWLNIANEGLIPRTGTPTFTPVAMFDADDGRFSPTFWSDVATLPINYALRVFFQVTAQWLSSILSKQWVLDWVIPNGPDMNLSVPGTQVEWDGDFSHWADYTGWSESALDKIGTTYPGVTCGTGPYILDRYNPSNGGEWSAVKYDEYWGGWPAKGPSPPYSPSAISGIKPAGYVMRLTVRQRSLFDCVSDLKSGTVDVADVVSTYALNLHVGNDRRGPTLPGIKLNYPIPNLYTNYMVFTFFIEPTLNNHYGKINSNNTLSEDGIPANFFSDVHVRRAFANLLNYTYIEKDLYLGECYQLTTFAPDGLPYINMSLPKRYGPDTDFAQAKTELDAAFGGALATTGFTVYIPSTGSAAPATALPSYLEYVITEIGNTYYGGRFHAQTVSCSWGEYVDDMALHRLPLFIMGWLPRRADINEYAHVTMHSEGFLPMCQRYTNPEADVLVPDGLRTPDGPLRQAIYYRFEELYYNDIPSIPLYVTTKRAYSRSWLNGQYCNPIYMSCIYAYNLWKWEYLGGDVNYDGKTSLEDITSILDSFGSTATPHGSLSSHARWNFNCDIAGSEEGWRDRKTDLSDISVALDNFGEMEQTWTPP
jgi:peptide/nickel transport system substrate-binding protein